MSATQYTVTYDHGTAHGQLAVWSEGGEKAALEQARKELRRRRLPQIASEGRLRVASSRALNPSTPAVDRDERDVLAQLEIAGSHWKIFESDGDAYKAALRLVERGLAKRVASGETTTRPVRKWIEISVTKQGLLAAANRAPNEIVVLVTAAPHRGVREMPVLVDAFEGVLAVHPSLRNMQEIDLAVSGKPESWGITHVPSGQLVATVSLLPWARRLAKEIMAFADESITSTDPRVAALAIGGPGMVRAGYIGDVARQARSRRGTFPTFAAWRKTAGLPSDPPRANNPRTYSFIRHDETPVLVLGQIGWPQIWSYRGAEISIRPWPGGAATATVVSPSLNWANRTIHTMDVHAALRAAKYTIDLAHAAKGQMSLARIVNTINDEANRLKSEGVPLTRQTLARAVTTGDMAYPADRKWFESKPVAFRLEVIDFVLEYRTLQGIDHCPRPNPRTYSFIRQDETPTLVLGQMGWPQIWSYRGTEITIAPHPSGHPVTVKVTTPPQSDGSRLYLWADDVSDVHSALRLGKWQVDLQQAGKQEPRLLGIVNATDMVAEYLKGRGVPRTRWALAREMNVLKYQLPDLKWFESQPVAFRLEVIDFVLEYRALQGLDPWPSPNPRRPNPEDLAGQAAVSAAIGALVGGFIGAAAGVVIFGAAGFALGAMASSTTGATTGLAIGAVFGIPLGAYIGTIWGAVRQTGRAMGRHPSSRRVKVLAGIGAAVTGPLAPVGAAVGAYLGAPST